MGVAYIHIILNTPHKNWVSRKNTIDVDSNSPTPKLKITRQVKKNSARTADLWNSIPVTKHTINKGIRDITKLIRDDKTRVKG